MQFIKDLLEWLIETFTALLAREQGKQGDAPASIPIPTRLPRNKPQELPEPTEEEPAPRPKRSNNGIQIDPNYKSRKGFNRRFLSIALPFPQLAPKWSTSVVEYKEELNSVMQMELKYHHFSIVMNLDRKMPFFTAVNIDGASYELLKDQVPTRKEIGPDKWFLDPRIAPAHQLDDDFYKGNDFDIGHIVRREDALWGDTLEMALKANNDTFHLTNACPQHKDFNRNAQRWLGLEDYALKNARKYGLKISVYSGPVFKKNDQRFNGVRIPASFWKIIVMIKDDGAPSATGYLIKQSDLIDEMEKQGFVYGQFQTYQVPLSEIERLTDIHFALNHYDPLQKPQRRSLVYQPLVIDEFEAIEW